MTFSCYSQWRSPRGHVLGLEYPQGHIFRGIGLVLIGQRNFQWHISISTHIEAAEKKVLSSYDLCEDRYSDVLCRAKSDYIPSRPRRLHNHRVDRWRNNYDVLITARNNRSRPIDRYLVIVRVIMCIHGFQGSVASSLAVQVGRTMCLGLGLSSVCIGVAACFQTSCKSLQSNGRQPVLGRWQSTVRQSRKHALRPTSTWCFPEYTLCSCVRLTIFRNNVFGIAVCTQSI